RQAGWRIGGFARKARVLFDAGDARAAYSPRESDIEHLHQSGADRLDGYGFHDRIWQAGLARVGAAESGKGALPGGQGEAEILRAVLQRVRSESGRANARRME